MQLFSNFYKENMFNIGALLMLAILAVAYGDVSHLFNNKPSRFQPSQYKQQPRPVAHAPSSVQHHSQGQIGILKQHSDISADGSYDFGYETENGISHQEGATIKQNGAENVAKSAQGSYSFTSPEGELVQISYIADENGFQPQGSHIPTPPPIPDAIQRAIDYILAHPSPNSYYQDDQQQPQQKTYQQPQFGGRRQKPRYG